MRCGAWLSWGYARAPASCLPRRGPGRQRRACGEAGRGAPQCAHIARDAGRRLASFNIGHHEPGHAHPPRHRFLRHLAAQTRCPDVPPQALQRLLDGGWGKFRDLCGSWHVVFKLHFDVKCTLHITQIFDLSNWQAQPDIDGTIVFPYFHAHEKRHRNPARRFRPLDLPEH